MEEESSNPVPVTVGGTSILHTGNLLGNTQKYVELIGLAELLHPDVLVLNGNLLPPCSEGPAKQIAFIDIFLFYVEVLKAHCGQVIFMFAGTDTKIARDEAFSDARQYLSGIPNNYDVFKNPVKIGRTDYVIVGCPYEMDVADRDLKDWAGVDGPVVCAHPISDTPVRTEDGNVVIMDEEELHSHICQNCNIECWLEERLSDERLKDKKVVLLYQRVPMSMESTRETIFSYELDGALEKHKNVELVLCANENNTFFDRAAWKGKVHNATILQSNQHPNCLFYTFAYLNQRGNYFYHPMEKTPSNMKIAILAYNGVSNATTDK